MKIIAGVDEAGLGPMLGPLVVSCAALRVPDDWQAASPWEKLSAAVVKTPSRKETRLSVGDSKKVYSALGEAALERTALSFLACREDQVAALARADKSGLLAALAADVATAHMSEYPWYADTDWTLPDVAGAAKTLAEALAGQHCAVAELRADVLLEGGFNQLLASGLNKNELLLSRTGAHLRHLENKFADERLEVVVDKQGGRNFYHPLLMQLFPEKWIDIIVEGADKSVYRLRRESGAGGANRDAIFTFIPKADDTAFCVSLASIICKYLRERFMADLNAFFAARVPGLQPTAGYPADAPRFIEQVESICKELKLADAIFVRQK